MQSDDAKVKSFSSPLFKRSSVTKATSAIIRSQIQEIRPLILAELGKICESRGGQLNDDQVAAVAGIISHLYHPSEIFARLADWLESNNADRKLAKDWLKTQVGQQCAANAWYDAETRRDLPKDELTGLMEITDEEAEALGLAHLVSDRLRKRMARRAEGIQARTKAEPWKDQRISKAAYYRRLSAEKAGMAASAGDARPSQAESRPWEALGISRATYFRQRPKGNAQKTECVDSVSHRETPGETRTSVLEREDSSPLSSLYIRTFESHGESHQSPALPPVPLTDPIACARARDRGDDCFYFIPASRDASKRLCDLQHLGPDLLIDFADIENGEYPQTDYRGLWSFRSHVSLFPADVDRAPPPIDPMKRLPGSIARQFAHKALQLGLVWEDPAYWDENPWSWFVDDQRSYDADVHAALSPLAERFSRALRRQRGIAASKARKAAKAAPEPARVEFNAATMHPPCCSPEDWLAVPLPLRNRALIIAGDIFMSGAWQRQKMDCLAIGIIGAERAETRRKLLVRLCPDATPAEIETAAIGCWQLPISQVPNFAASLNQHIADRIRIETAHLQPEIIERMDWIMSQKWSEEIIRGDVDLEKVRERMAKALIAIDVDTWQTASREILKTAVTRVKDPRFEPTTKASENRIWALVKREYMIV